MIKFYLMSFICFVLAAYILYIPSRRKAVFCVQELHRRHEAAGRLRVRALQAVASQPYSCDNQFLYHYKGIIN